MKTLIPQMQTLRTLYAQKHFLTFSSKFHRHFKSKPQNLTHFTNHRQSTSTVGKIEGTPSTSTLNSSSSQNGKSPSLSRIWNNCERKKTIWDNIDKQLIDSNKFRIIQNPRLSSLDEEVNSKKEMFYKGVSSGWFRKKGESKVTWVCSDCGHCHEQFWASCLGCKSFWKLKRFSEEGENGGGKTGGFSDTVTHSWLPQDEAAPVRLSDVKTGMKTDWRFPLSGLLGNEVATVLGGGLVPGSLVLVGGDPGVGKSTLMLQIAAILAEGHHDMGQPSPVVYISGEENVQQIGNRADRMRIRTEDLFLYSSPDIKDILEKTQNLSPRALIIDSIQTVYLNGVSGSAGGLSQVKECTSALLRFAKKTNIPVLLTGHLTKTGDIAGPRLLEHVVDVVLYMEGEKHTSHRLLRTLKNRFGSTDELGVLEMSQSGLQAVSNPSDFFLSEQHLDSEILAGVAVAVTMEGSRSFLIEIQALCLSCSLLSVHVNGVKPDRPKMIISVLAKQAGLKVLDSGIYINVVGGYNLTDTGGDLAIAASICSSLLGFPIPKGVAFIGEIGLAGELRAVPRMEKRVNTVAKLGYKMCIVPKSSVKSLSAVLKEENIEILGCHDLKEVFVEMELAHPRGRM